MSGNIPPITTRSKHDNTPAIRFAYRSLKPATNVFSPVGWEIHINRGTGNATPVWFWLGQVRLEKFIRAKSETPARLPANTFAAKFAGKWSKKTSGELRDHLRKKVKEIIVDEGLSAKILVVVGNNWAWGLGKV
jgi:hypothetical protein